MKEYRKHGQVGRAAMKADMDRKTARKYLREGKLPSELKQGERTWRTRPDPFAEDWAWVEQKLLETPALEAKALFEALQERRPGHYQDGQVRTLQRRIKRWRATEGPDKEVFFPQEHRPGEALQTDFTHATSLQVTIAGVVFAHMLCHVVLPYSNWQWLTVCLSESFLALKRGIQEAVFRLEHLPIWHQTDNTSAATHRVTPGRRAFNDDYAALMAHFGMKPRTIKIGKKEQNGDVEASHGALKRWLEQRLLLRGSRDFDDVDSYEQWLWSQLLMRNRGRQKRFEQELSSMAPLMAARLGAYSELSVRVTSYSTIRVAHNTYSVPSRLRGEWVRVRLYERHVEVRCAGKPQLTIERLRGRMGHRIDYRHIIWSMVRKPGAFARYRYREELFPSQVFRQAYDVIYAQRPDVRGDLQYLRILHLAAATMPCVVQDALEQLLAAGEVPSADVLKTMLGMEISGEGPPPLAPYSVELASYDELLGDSQSWLATTPVHAASEMAAAREVAS